MNLQKPHNITTLPRLIFRRIYAKISPDNHERAVFKMENEKPQGNQAGFPSDDHNGIGFLFKKIGITHTLLSYWMTVPEFVERIKTLQSQPITIDESMVFDIMREIYSQKLSDKENGIETGFMFYPAKRALRALSLKLTGDRDAWET